MPYGASGCAISSCGWSPGPAAAVGLCHFAIRQTPDWGIAGLFGAISRLLLVAGFFTNICYSYVQLFQPARDRDCGDSRSGTELGKKLSIGARIIVWLRVGRSRGESSDTP